MKIDLINFMNSPLFQIIAFLLGVMIFKIYSSISLKNKIKFFLYNNGYVAIDHKTKKDIYPEVSFFKNYISIKKSVRKSSAEILIDKNLWEESFSKEISQKKIADVIFYKNEIRLMIL